MVTSIPTPICSQCGNETIPIVIDDGVGFNYYGSSRSFHSDKRIESICCESHVIEKSTSKRYTMKEYNEWEFYHKF